MKRFRVFFYAVVFAIAASSGRSCDLCGCYTPQLEAMAAIHSSSNEWWNGFYAAVAEQFTPFGTLQLNRNEIGNPTRQYENSSISQIVAGYGVNDRLAVQFNLPVLYRDFKRPLGFTIDRGTES